jgi:hypothetical protein
MRGAWLDSVKNSGMRVRQHGEAPHFVSYKFPTGEAIFTVEEYSAVVAHAHTLASRWITQGTGEYAVAYGTYLAQKGVDSAQARADALACKGFALGYLVGGAMVETLELVDIEIYAEDRRARGLPFAALVRIGGDAVRALRSQSALIAGFLRYGNLDAATNIANRPGVFAMRALGGPLRADVRRQWRRTVDGTQVVRAARGVIC